MSKKKNPIASAMADLRWAKATPEAKAAHIAKMNKKRAENRDKRKK